MRAPARQRGIATLLVILLVGLALTATTLGVVWEVRGTQDKVLSVHTATLDATTLAALPTTLPVGGIDGITIASVSVSGSASPYQVVADITGTGAASVATIRAVYAVTPDDAGDGGETLCAAATPAAAMVFNGDLDYSGGSLVVENTAADFTDIAVGGDITVHSGSSAKISGCATGDVTLSGGGIKDGASLKAGGTITVSSMSAPSNATMWAKNIVYGTAGSGTFTAMEAGAYAADVYANGVKIGTANVGGHILPSTAGGTIPWTTGTLVPQSSDAIVITLDDDSGSFLLPMSGVSIDTDTGAVSGGAAELLSGAGALPDSLRFLATGIYGGDISLYVQTIATLWGHTTDIRGYGGTYTNLYSNGNLKIVTGTISNLIGGGDLWAANGGASGSNFPTIASGKIAGTIRYGSEPIELPATGMLSVSRSQANTSPGLPGVPYCDTRVDTVDAVSLQSSANYVFYFDNTTSHPMLRIQNVRTADGGSVDAGPYDLATDDVRTIAGQDFMQCGWYDDHCLRDATPGSGWTLSGIHRFPPGVAWFDGPLTIAGVDPSTQTNLYDSLIATGDIVLTSSGHVPLYAPNFATPSQICGGDFRPSNLCDDSGSTPAFANWTDAAGTAHAGLPIGNVAILTNGALTSSGWEIHGNVLLGDSIDTGGATTTIYGTATVGANHAAPTTISQGGIRIVTDGLSNDRIELPANVCTITGPSSGSGAVTIWTRYL